MIERDPAYGQRGDRVLQTWLRGIYEDSLEVPEPSRLERLTRQMAGVGGLSSLDGARATAAPHAARTTARILSLWDEVDVLLTPGLALTPIAAEGG